MSVIADFSFMDEIKIEDDLLNEEKILSHDSFWNGSGAELFDSDLTLDFLRNEEFLPSQTLENVSGSVCSDSGLSSDQQFSPVSFDEIEEEIDSKPNISFNQSVLDILCKDTCGERITLHKSEEDDDDSIDVCTIKTSTTKPVVRVKPSLSRSSVKVVNVSSLQNNPRSLLIPVKGKSGMKTIKIIKPCSKFQRRMSTTSNVSTRTICEPIDELKSSSDEGSDETDHQQSSSRYPRVQLTEEEKRLMVKEGISIPTHYPLTKQEERDLKRIRRKIRNKISAQDSRKRKKEYVDGLEDRVKQCSVENASLIKRVKALQNENQSLSTQLKRLQALIAPTSSNSSLGTGTSTGSSHPTGSSSSSPAQPATCLIVLVLSLALIMAPDLRGSRSSVNNSTSGDLVLPQHKSNSIIHSGVRSRNLLSVPDKSSRGVGGDRKLILEDDKKVLLEMLDLEGGAERDHDYTYRSPSNQRKRSRSFIDPPLDEVWPPPKTDVFDYKRIRFDQRPTTPELEHIFEVEVTSEA